MDTIVVAFALLIGLLLLFAIFIYGRFPYMTQRLRMAGPPPSLFTGNLRYLAKEGAHAAYVKWIQEYGRIFRVWMGRRACLVVTDLDAIHQIMSKKFPSFINRTVDTYREPLFHHSIMNVRGDDWKRIRSVISPIFTSSRLRAMTPAIQKGVDIMMDHVAKMAADQSDIDAMRLFHGLTLDVITTTAMRMELDCQNHPDSEFVRYCEMAIAPKFSFLQKSIGLLPFSEHLRRLLRVSTADASVAPYFDRILTESIRKRQGISQTPDDFLQLLIDAMHGNSTRNRQGYTIVHAGLSEIEVKAQALFFVVAAYETTSTTLTFAVHCLATHPNWQARVRDEIDSAMGEDELTHDNIQNLRCLDQVIAEVLRLYPPVKALTTISGLEIPAGSHISVPVYTIHRDPLYYPRPEVFDPERFSDINRPNLHPAQYLPFGIGPRQCLGKRFALDEVKITLVNLLRHYVITPSPNAETPISIDPKSFFLKSDTPVVVRVKARPRQ